jgi:hypothetical protein
MFLASALALAADDHSVFVLTSTNDPNTNQVVVFKFDPSGPSLTSVGTLPTGGKGGASTNAGILQFKGNLGAVANYGSNSVTRLERNGNYFSVAGTIQLAPGCVKPDSVALTRNQLFVVGTTCAESHAWPWGGVDGSVVSLPDNSAAQIAVGQSWAAVTLSSGSLLQLPLTGDYGALSGASNSIPLPDDANTVPLGEAFWGDVLGFTPAHSADNFAIVDKNQNVYPVMFPDPPGPYPTNAPCWVAKGAGNIWYTGNSPGTAVSIFFSDAQGGVFYKSVSVPGVPTDISVSPDGKWLAVIYTTGTAPSTDAYVAVYSIDAYGDLTPVANSNSVGATAFSGVAFSE